MDFCMTEFNLIKKINPNKAITSRSILNIRKRQQQHPVFILTMFFSSVLLFSSLYVFPNNSAYAANILGGPQFLAWADGSDFTTFGPNSEIRILSGVMQYVADCFEETNGVNDFINPFTDLYIVPSGSVGIGSTLADVSGAPNTVQGASDGAFVSESIGFTGPVGTIGDGRYAIVYDECQDGKVQAYDAIFDPAFEVYTPTDIPLIDIGEHFQNVKSAAESQRRSWEITGIGVKTIFAIQSKWELISWSFPIFDLQEGFLWILTQAEHYEFLQDPKDAATTNIDNMVKHFAGIVADPPDPNFMQNTPLAGRKAIEPYSDDPRIIEISRFGSTIDNENALLQAFLSSIERYSGAQEAGNGQWALIHAREIKNYANILAQEQIPLTTLAIENILNGLLLETRDIEGVNSKFLTLQNRIKQSGPSADELRNLRNLNFSDTQIQDTINAFLATDFKSSNKTDVINHLQSIRNDNGALITHLNNFALEIDSIINNLTSNENINDQTPIANAGGPYTGIEGDFIAFNGSQSRSREPLSGENGSQQGGDIVKYEWDLDGDGSFDDAASWKFVYCFI